MIYGVALLAGCMWLGSFIGELLGLLTGINSDIGGVGFSDSNKFRKNIV